MNQYLFTRLIKNGRIMKDPRQAALQYLVCLTQKYGLCSLSAFPPRNFVSIDDDGEKEEHFMTGIPGQLFFLVHFDISLERPRCLQFAKLFEFVPKQAIWMASRAERKQILECKAKTTLQYSHDYFDYYYRDEPYPDIPARQDIFKTFPMPRWYSTRRPDPALNHSRPVGPQIQDRMGQEFWRDTRTDAGTDRELDPSVRQKLESLDIEIGKILGAGSQGLAIAIKFKGKNMVVKYATDIQSMVVEMWAMKEMVGARHIVQVSSCQASWGASK